MDITVFLLILLALTFDFLNGFHDAANSIATIVSTRVLTPRWAVFWAASFNFIALLFFGLHVATTIGKGIIDITVVDNHIIFATLIGACAWNLLTWFWGLPTSSSHALMGGLVGSALMKAGLPALVYSGIFKTVAFMFLSPMLGLGSALGSAILFTGCSETSHHTMWTICSEKASLFLQHATASAMEEMTRRRPWVSLPGCCSAPDLSERNFIYQPGL